MGGRLHSLEGYDMLRCRVSVCDDGSAQLVVLRLVKQAPCPVEAEAHETPRHPALHLTVRESTSRRACSRQTCHWQSLVSACPLIYL
eukprot:6183957-Pleurochrysis_carterae.AAC.2